MAAYRRVDATLFQRCAGKNGDILLLEIKFWDNWSEDQNFALDLCCHYTVSRNSEWGWNLGDLTTSEMIMSQYHLRCCQITQTSTPFLSYFHCACAETADDLIDRDTFSEHELTFTFAICYRLSLSSVTFVHPTQRVEIFGNISTPFGTLAVRWHSLVILRRSSQPNIAIFLTFRRLYLANGAR